MAALTSGISSSDIAQSTHSGSAINEPTIANENQDSETCEISLENNYEIESNINKPMIPKENHISNSDDQCWSDVQTHAWTLLLTIAIKSFIEGIAFALTVQDSFYAGLAFLVTMIVKLLPVGPGYAIILKDAGLIHFWEKLPSGLAVLPIIVGKFVFC